ncbi:Shedu anti-phage system protein SduA domain-containing protein [Shewanella decolorationis]|uniref:Shedu anti-phage system protein SduA domain-containing protein n=1 Tax=Shewanella decolorationis TaxID=256839 RepID=UPI0010572E31|nr:Shedu anti-phage system protein SduA domain-containing protein [Shewanella decolorationis]
MKRISDLVLKNASEREIQKVFKEDLSLIGSTCAPKVISDEYIAFSEFPIGRGKADFVVFTDRSRMYVFLVEIKGANFSFVNNNRRIANEISAAAQQIRDRISQIQKSYETYRREFHAIRRSVEEGNTLYNSFLGPNGYLNVDPEKDIKVRGLVIGGRTRNDHEESNLRNQLEEDSLKINFESWDSWLRKVTPVPQLS